MSYKFFDEDTLVYLSKYFNKSFVSVSPLRNSQDGKFVKRIRKRALDKLGNGGTCLPNPKLFYVGCVDFMVTETDDKKEFVILESNGGSSRGLLSMTEGQTEAIFSAYKEAIDTSVEEDDENRTKIVLIGTVSDDPLFQEKIMLVEYLKHKYQIDGYKVNIYNPNSFNFEKEEDFKDDIALIISSYTNILKHLSFKEQYATFKDYKVDVVIGDGVARRFPLISAYIKNSWEQVKTLIVNIVYQVSDDKANTYYGIELGYDRLKKYRIKKLNFGKSNDPYALQNKIQTIIDQSDRNYIIKPYAGSGGVGIQAVSPDFKDRSAEQIMESSISEFYEKFDVRRNPFPYTIQEMADFSLIDFRDSKRTYDIRVYVAQKEGKIIPIGGEGRIARLPYTGTLKKEEFVVNISGFNGIEVDRAVPFSASGLKVLNLSEEDLVDMFCAACELFGIISEKFMEIISNNNWELKLNN